MPSPRKRSTAPPEPTAEDLAALGRMFEQLPAVAELEPFDATPAELERWGYPPAELALKLKAGRLTKVEADWWRLSSHVCDLVEFPEGGPRWAVMPVVLTFLDWLARDGARRRKGDAAA